MSIASPCEDTQAKEVRKAFERVGTIRDIILHKKRNKWNQRYGFVITPSVWEVQKVIKSLQGSELKGRKLKLSFANSKHKWDDKRRDYGALQVKKEENYNNLFWECEIARVVLQLYLVILLKFAIKKLIFKLRHIPHYSTRFDFTSLVFFESFIMFHLFTPTNLFFLNFYSLESTTIVNIRIMVEQLTINNLQI